MLKKYVFFFIIFSGFLLFLGRPVYAKTVVPQPAKHWYDGIASVVSDIVTLNNPVQLKHPKSNFFGAKQPTFTLAIPIYTKNNIGNTATNIWKTQQEKITAAIVAKDGTSYPAIITKVNEGTFVLAANTTTLPHGDFTLKVAAQETAFYTRNLSQDFSWGVLAFNTNKSIYAPHETAHLAFGIVDDKGHTLCKAALIATITDPHGNTTVLSTSQGSIRRSSDCAGDTYVETPDYAADYTTNDSGTYQVHVVGKNTNGIHAIDDFFEVKDQTPFTVERVSFPTRIYPAASYTVKLKITANEDYTGEVSDSVPKAFRITNISDNGSFSGDKAKIINNTDPTVLQEDAVAYKRLGKNQSLLLHEMISLPIKDRQGKIVGYELVHPDQTNIDTSPAPIVWHVHWQQGRIYTLTYTIHFPPVSPEFYLIGPFTVGTNTNPVFSEVRQWEIAADATVCWTAASSGNWSTGANWSTGSAPGASDIATFDNAGSTCATGTNTNATIDASFGGSVAGINIISTYTGVITQNKAMTVGASNYSQANGTYSGGSTAFTNNGTYSLSGGTFTATTNTFTQVGNFTFSSGTFTGSGNLTLKPSGNGTQTFTGSVTVASFTASETTAANFPTISIDSATTITSTGLVTLSHSTGATTDSKINGGNIAAQGDLTVSGEGWEGSTIVTMTKASPSITGVSSGDGFVPGMTFNDSGTITLTNRIVMSGNVTYQAGTFSGGTWWVSPVGASGSMTINGTFTLPNLEFFQYNGTWTPTYTISSGATITVTGTTTFASKTGGGTGTINGSGTLAMQGASISTTNTGFKGASTLTLAFTGSSSQTVTASGTNFPGSVLINKTGGTVTLAANWNLNTSGATFTVSAGTLDLAGFNLTVNSTLNANGTGQINLQGGETVTTAGNSFTSGSTVNYYGSGTYASLILGNTYYNLTFSGTGSYTPNSSVTVNGSFTLSNGTFVAPTNLTVGGSFSTSGGTFTQGSNTVTFIDNTQTAVISGTNTFYNLTSVTSGKHITFPASVTTTVSNTLTIRGSSSSNLVIRSSSTNTQWSLNVQGTINASYIDVEDTNACPSVNTPITATSSKNSGNNSCWLFPGNSWYNSNWGYRIRITVNHTKVPSDLTNFPVLVSLTNATLAAHALSSGNDILFTDSDGVTVLPYEIEHYNSGTGELESWVQVPTVSSTQDTIIYMYFGYSSATSQQNVNGVWDSDFKQVLHLKETSGSTVSDSTSKANNGTKFSGGSTSSSFPAPTTSGEIDGAQSFTSANSSYIQTNNTSFPTGDFTFEFWFQPSTTANMYVLNSDNAVWFDYNITSANKMTLHLAGAGINVISTTSLSAGSWYFISGTRSGSTVTLYVNGSSDQTGSGSTAISYGACGVLVIGSNTTVGNCNGNGGSYANGIIDEVRVSDIARSSAWIQAEYNNATNPSTFLSIFPVTNPPSVQIHGGVKFQQGSKIKAS